MISRAVRRVKFETILNITSGIYDKYHVQIMLLFVYTTTHKRFVIFTCRYFKLSWHTTALSQSNWRNFSCSSINTDIFARRRGAQWSSKKCTKKVMHVWNCCLAHKTNCQGSCRDLNSWQSLEICPTNFQIWIKSEKTWFFFFSKLQQVLQKGIFFSFW